MSIDIIARALASQAGSNATVAQASANTASQRAASLDLFTNLGSRMVDTSVNTVVTGGYATAGVGGGRYVCDALATGALASAYSRFCKQSADGRYWRVALVDGFVPVAAGGVIGSDTVDYSANHQPGLQEACAYAGAVAGAGVLLDKRNYALWCPAAPGSITTTTAAYGAVHPLIISSNLAIRSAVGTGSYLWRRTPTGGDPAAVGAWQTLGAGQYWRGGMFWIAGAVSAPADWNQRAALTLDNVHLRGGVPQAADGGGGNFRASDGGGWDLTDKAVCAATDNPVRYVGDIRFVGDCSIDGFGGELLYQGGGNGGQVYQRGRLKLSNSNGDGLSPGGFGTAYRLDIDWVEIENCYQGIEGWTGHRGRIRGRITNCPHAAFSLQGGKPSAGTRSAYYNPARIISTEAPLGQIDLICQNSGPAYPGSWLTGKLTCIDTQLIIGTPVYADGMYGLDLESVQMVVDQNTNAAVSFIGSGTAGEQLVKNNRIRSLAFDRTEAAVAAGRFANTVIWYGSLGKDNRIDSLTCDSGSSLPQLASTTPDYAPVIRAVPLLSPGGGGNCLVNAQTTPTIPWNGPLVWLNSTTPTVAAGFAVTMSHSNVQPGQEVRLRNITSQAMFRLGTSNTRMKRAAVIKPNSSLLLRSDGSMWELVEGGVEPMTFAQAITFQTAAAPIPANAVSDETSVSAPGVTRGDRVEVTLPAADIPADALLYARATTDAIKVRCKNLNTGASLTMAAGTYQFSVTPSS